MSDAVAVSGPLVRFAWAVIAASVSGSPPWLDDTAAVDPFDLGFVNPHGLRNAGQLDLELAQPRRPPCRWQRWRRALRDVGADGFGVGDDQVIE